MKESSWLGWLISNPLKTLFFSKGKEQLNIHRIASIEYVFQYRLILKSLR